MVLEQSGILRVLSGLQGNIVIPRQEAAATAYSVSEIGALTASQQILGQIVLSPKRVGSTQTYSKQFVMQSTPDAEAFIRDDHFQVLARQWDRLGINGQGAGERYALSHAAGKLTGHKRFEAAKAHHLELHLYHYIYHILIELRVFF